jgi:hypothetical protein
MPEDVKLEFDPMDMRQLLAAMASVAIGNIALRAFPADGTKSRDVDNQEVPSLSHKYREYKSGTKTYKDDLTARTARALRRRSGKPGPGPLVTLGGETRRLGRRLPVANQRLSDYTAKALGVISLDDNRAVLGFRDRRSRMVAGHLQKRNKFFGLTISETAELREIAQLRADKLTRKIRVRNGVISIEL